MTVAIYTNENKDVGLKVTGRIVRHLEGKCNIAHRTDYDSFEAMCRAADVLIVLGGDGTLLRTAKAVCSYGIPILGINLGKVGFMAEVEIDRVEDCLNRLLAGDYEIEQRFMIKAEIIRDGKSVGCYNALNDAVVSSSSFKSVLSMNLYVNDDYITSYDADGVIAATPTGSTAYSLSAGGPITDSTMELILVTPICPHTLSSRPLILPSDKKISIEVTKDRAKSSLLSVDGKEGERLYVGDRVVITASESTTKLIRVNGMNFYEILRKKMSN